MSSLRVHEIFYSLQGEARTSGRPTVFVRLTGCPLRCVWCDTAYAFSGGQLMEYASILEQIKAHETPWVCITGGEPLAQPGCLELLTQLCDLNYQVSLETSGALSIADVDSRVSRVMDLKAPDSGEAHRNLTSNIPLLTPHDQIKFVLASKHDFDWALQQCETYQLFSRVSDVWASPVHGQLDAGELAEWILASHRPWRLQLQLHKILWNNEPGR